MSQRARKLFLVEDLERGGFGMSRREQQGCCRHDDRKLRNEVSPSFYAAIDPDTAAAGGLRLSDGRVEEFWYSHAVEHFAHCNSTPALICAETARHNSATACNSDASELSQESREKTAHRIHTDVPLRNSMNGAVNRFATGARA